MRRALVDGLPPEQSDRYDARMMTPDQWCATSWRASPGSFVSLMTLYESNYIRLGWLCGDLARLADGGAARIDASLTLEYRVEERGPYTTLLSFSLSADGGSADGLPELLVRVYHDARVVEASEIRHRAPSAPSLPVSGETLAPRWARNMMLNKWLEYCADRGCRFEPATALAV
jgi:uncharacterized protein